jgi:hypothetical protein
MFTACDGRVYNVPGIPRCVMAVLILSLRDFSVALCVSLYRRVCFAGRCASSVDLLDEHAH